MRPGPEDRRGDAGQRERGGHDVEAGCRAGWRSGCPGARRAWPPPGWRPRRAAGCGRSARPARPPPGATWRWSGRGRPGRGACQIRGVLHGQRAVELPALAQLGHRLLGRHVAGEEARGIAGDEADHREHQDRDQQQGGHAGQAAGEAEAQHGRRGRRASPRSGPGGAGRATPAGSSRAPSGSSWPPRSAARRRGRWRARPP